MKQTTIQNPVSVRGVGLHTGKAVNLTFKPAEANHGFRFQRIDLPDQPLIPADVKYVVSTNRGTTLRNGEADVWTVEHVLSALTGLGLDNVLMEIDGPEMPIMDGTAMPFIEILQKNAGKLVQDADRDYLVIDEPISYKDEVTGTELLALPADAFEATVMVDFNSKVLGPQFAALNGMDEYVAEIAPCRTFVFVHELEKLLDMGLIKGGDLDNAIVIADRKMEARELEELAKKLGKPGVKVEAEGVLNTVQLRFQNEPARHKLLDVIGDLALIGKPIRGKIVATKPGHTANVEFAKLLKKHLTDQRRLLGIPKYDPEKEPVYDNAGVTKMLPHRFPFLMVDKIMEISQNHVIGIKNVTMNEAFFQGHFPNNPIFPGVLQIEAMAQTGGILALHNVPDPGNWDTYFLKIDNAKFKAKVVPGDTLILKLELLEPIRRGIVHMHGAAYVGSKLVSEGELTAQVVRRRTEATEPQSS
ncbi:MAG: bifunctional UDP-3-O-[3-hydroxymyristoyl] N-acetylglucosamine deacetylase/3-hydroxyacyl-ACP dehydratase [Saprospiraceae bacterium]|nr:bifunctional UDP-3-O-[3-hydroxymyristoyl] N-acetylglucosamine deacetylase/3-hydroxyacyl-ACP dehydratase [Saprospiraceae bacterium]